MNLDEKTYKEYDTVYRYKKSIFFDQIIAFIPLAVFVIVGGVLSSKGFDFVKYIFFFLAILVFALYFISDRIFGGSSLGKKIYKIKLVENSSNIIPTINSIIHRRLLEVYIHPMLTKMNFLEKSKHIDKTTNTKITKI